jgi:hypothetical protein
VLAKPAGFLEHCFGRGVGDFALVHGAPCGGADSHAQCPMLLTTSSVIFLASPNSIIVRSM